jgi:hypothetical protein
MAVSKNVTVALPVAFMLPFVAGLAALVSSAAARPRMSTSALFAALVALVLIGFVAITRRRHPRAGALAACHAVAWAPFVALGTWAALDTPIVHGARFACGTGLMAFLLFAVPVGAIVLFAMGIGAGVGFVHRSTNRALRTVAVGATAVALIAFAFAAPRLGRPDPDTFLESLSIVGEIGVDADVKLGATSLAYRRVMVTDPPSAVPDEGPGQPLPPRAECQLTGLERMETFYPVDDRCPALRLLRDSGHDLAVIDSPAAGRTGAGSIAFRPSNGEELELSPKSVADRIAPPIGWTIAAALGGMFGAALVLAASRARRRAAALDGTEAQHVGDGYVVLPNGDRVLVDVAAQLPVGPVVLDGGAERLPTYRIMGAPTFVSARAGTLDVHREAMTDLAASFDAMAIAVAVLGGTPLVVARVLGLL